MRPTWKELKQKIEDLGVKDNDVIDHIYLGVQWRNNKLYVKNLETGSKAVAIWDVPVDKKA